MVEFDRRLRCLEDSTVTLVSRDTFTALGKASSHAQQSLLAEVIDKLGALSAKAQGYQIITSATKFLSPSTHHRLYIYAEAGVALGFIKVGHVTLYVYDVAGILQRIEPLCVLDFFVSESRQRTGIGRKLFDSMLEHERTEASKIGYDRPSPKFLSFLSKYFQLQKYVPQTNGFVVFNDYYGAVPKPQATRRPPELSINPAPSPLAAAAPTKSSMFSSTSQSPLQHAASHMIMSNPYTSGTNSHPGSAHKETRAGAGYNSPAHAMLGNAPSTTMLRQLREDPGRYSPPPPKVSPTSLAAEQSSFCNARRMSAVANNAVATTMEQQHQAQQQQHQYAAASPAQSSFPKSSYRSSFDAAATGKGGFESRSFTYQPSMPSLATHLYDQSRHNPSVHSNHTPVNSHTSQTNTNGQMDSIDELVRGNRPLPSPSQQPPRPSASLPSPFRPLVDPKSSALPSPSTGAAGMWGPTAGMRAQSRSQSMQGYAIDANVAASPPVRVLPPRKNGIWG